MITNSQVKLIHKAKDRLGLNYEDYREILSLYGDVRNPGDLTPEGFFRVMEHLRELGFEARAGDAAGGQPRGEKDTILIQMVTPGQRNTIKRLVKRLGWSEDPERLEQFISRRLNIRKVRTKAEATRVIVALKAMLAANKDKNAGAG